MFVALFILAAIVVAAPIAAAVLVSLASNGEDRRWTLTRPASGPVESAARRIVGYHSGGIGWLDAAGRSRYSYDRWTLGAGVVRPPASPAALIGSRTADWAPLDEESSAFSALDELSAVLPGSGGCPSLTESVTV